MNNINEAKTAVNPQLKAILNPPVDQNNLNFKNIVSSLKTNIVFFVFLKKSGEVRYFLGTKNKLCLDKTTGGSPAPMATPTAPLPMVDLEKWYKTRSLVQSSGAEGVDWRSMSFQTIKFGYYFPIKEWDATTFLLDVHIPIMNGDITIDDVLNDIITRHTSEINRRITELQTKQNNLLTYNSQIKSGKVSDPSQINVGSFMNSTIDGVLE